MAEVDPETGIWSLSIASRRHKFDEGLAAAIHLVYQTCPSVADLGCGIGSYCAYLADNGHPTVHGYEGTDGIDKIAVYPDVFIMDLTIRRPVGIHYDLVLCIEVGEHIPKMGERNFLLNLNDFVSKHLVLSWAPPGQGSASGHVNCRPREWVVNRMSTMGLHLSKKRTAFLRNSATLRWLKRNIMAFERIS